MGKEAGKVRVVLPANRGLGRASGHPFEEEDKRVQGLKFCKRGRIKGIEVVDDQWYAKRFEQLPANTP